MLVFSSVGVGVGVSSSSYVPEDVIKGVSSGNLGEFLKSLVYAYK